MFSFKVTTVGFSSGVILTKAAMARLRVKKGDTLFLTEAPDGGYRITPYDPKFQRQMALAASPTGFGRTSRADEETGPSPDRRSAVW